MRVSDVSIPPVYHVGRAFKTASEAEAPLGRRQQAFVLFGMWFLTEAVFFSVAGFFHSYYMVTMAPAICALVGIGVVELWRDFRNSDQRTDWHGWLLPLAFVLTALVQARILSGYPTQSAALTPIVLVLSLGAAAALIVVCMRRARVQTWLPEGLIVERIEEPLDGGAAPQGERASLLAPQWAAVWQATVDRLSSLSSVLTKGALAIGVGALLLTPTTWVALSIAHPTSNLPAAGPTQRNPFTAGFGRDPAADGANPIGQMGGSQQTDAKLVRYLEANRGSTRYLLATQSAMTAAPFIIETGQPVMALGGFSGSDPILTSATVAQLVANHDVRYFLLQGGRQFSLGDLPPDLQDILGAGGPFAGGFFGGSGSSAQVSRWITTNCAQVSASAWGGTTNPTSGRGAGGQLYDCGAQTAAHTQR